jgi:hypothetical protein
MHPSTYITLRLECKELENIYLQILEFQKMLHKKQHYNPSVAVNPKAHMPKMAGCISVRFMCSAKS